MQKALMVEPKCRQRASYAIERVAFIEENRRSPREAHAREMTRKDTDRLRAAGFSDEDVLA